MSDINNEGDPNTVIETLYWLGCGALLLICCTLSRRTIPDERYHQGHIFRQQALNAIEQQRRRERLSDPVKRMAAIESALIVKRVESIDPDGSLVLGDSSLSKVLDKDDIETPSVQSKMHDSECAICFEKYHVGDSVAWSKSATLDPETECLHVYHHSCILSWLRDTWHDDCPSCRKTILVDEGDATQHTETSQSGNATGPFRIVNGLISRVRQSLIGSSIDIPSYDFRRVFSLGSKPSSNRGKHVDFAMNEPKSDNQLSSSSSVALRRVKSAGPGSPSPEDRGRSLSSNSFDDNLMYPVPDGLRIRKGMDGLVRDSVSFRLDESDYQDEDEEEDEIIKEEV